jgi:hypothetical protein
LKQKGDGKKLKIERDKERTIEREREKEIDKVNR